MDKNLILTLFEQENVFNNKVVTMSVTNEHRRKEHYYIKRINHCITNPYDDDTYERNGSHIIPMDLLTKVNGYGKHNHYIYVAMYDDYFYVWDFNHNRTVMNLGVGQYEGRREYLIGLSFSEADFDYQSYLEEIMGEKEKQDEQKV